MVLDVDRGFWLCASPTASSSADYHLAPPALHPGATAGSSTTTSHKPTSTQAAAGRLKVALASLSDETVDALDRFWMLLGMPSSSAGSGMTLSLPHAFLRGSECRYEGGKSSQKELLAVARVEKGGPAAAFGLGIGHSLSIRGLVRFRIQVHETVEAGHVELFDA